jgi:NADH dehydrogenase/NADH:ubiquinone oxidoreductase subunit G
MYKIGALTSKISAFKTRPWELKYVPSIDLHDTLGSKLLLNVKGRKVLRAVPSYNPNLQIEWASDKSRYMHEAYAKNRLSSPAFRAVVKTHKEKLTWAYKKVNTYTYVRILIQSWLANQSGFDLVVGTNLSLDFYLDLKEQGRKLGADVCSERSNHLIKTFNGDVLSNLNLKDLDQVESCQFLGVNIRLESPIANLIFRLRYLRGNFKTNFFGCADDLNINTKNYGSKGPDLQNFAFGKHIQNTYSQTKRLVVYGNSCSERQDCNSWLSLLGKLCKKEFFYIRLSTHVGILGQDYLNYGYWKEKNNTYFVSPNYETSTALVKHSLVGNTHLQEFLKKADFFYPISSYLEKNTLYLGYDGKLNYSYKAINPYNSCLKKVKDIIPISNSKSIFKKTFGSWKKTSLQSIIKNCTFGFKPKNCNNFWYNDQPLKVFKSPLKTYISNGYTPLPKLKISSTLMQLTNYYVHNYFNFL